MEAVVGAINGMRDELRETRLALEHIASILEVLILPEQAVSPSGCSHPEEQRIELAGMGEIGGFFCRACGVTVESQKVAHVD